MWTGKGDILREQNAIRGDFIEINGENVQFNRFNNGLINNTFARNTLIADNTGIDTTERIMGEGVPVSGNELTLVASPRIISIASTDANDTSAGTGLRTLLLVGIGTDDLELFEVISMNGQTEVDSVNTYKQVNELIGLTSGTNGTNFGFIYASDDTDTFTSGEPQNRVYDIMDIGHSLSKTGIFTVPINQDMMIKRIVINTDATESKPIKVNFYRTFNSRNIVLLVGTFYLSGIFISPFELDRLIAPGDTLFVKAINLGAGTVQASVKVHTILRSSVNG